MSLVIKLLFSFYVVYRQKHLSVFAVIYPSLTYIVFPLNPISAHSTAGGHSCHIFNVSIHQTVTERRFLYVHSTTEAVEISDCGKKKVWIIDGRRI